MLAKDEPIRNTAGVLTRYLHEFSARGYT